MDMKMNNKRFIAVDGGGTKTEFVRFDETGRVSARLVLGASNPNDIGLDNTVKLIAEGIEKLGADVVFAGISGCAAGGNKQKINDALAERFPNIDIRVDTDGLNAVALGGDGVDIALISGTGSVIFVRANGELHRIGGWGYLFDLVGSGYDLGAWAIRAALAEHDGIGERTLLTELLRRETGADIWQSLDGIYQKGKTYIASLAPLVFEAARAGDKTADKLIFMNASRLAVLLRRAQELCGTKKVALSGGLFENYGAELTEVLTALCPDTEFVFPALPPIYGAAREAMAGDIPSEFENNFGETYKEFL